MTPPNSPSEKKIHHVLACLTKDFYSPRNPGTLFSELYPNEFFNVNSSPYRIRQLMLRTRQWLEENSIPASILQNQGGYRLSIHGNFGIKLTLGSPAIDPNALKWLDLKKAFPKQVPFTAEQACRRLSCSRTGFRRLADWALQNGELTKSGNGKSTLYQIVSAAHSQFEKTAG